MRQRGSEEYPVEKIAPGDRLVQAKDFVGIRTDPHVFLTGSGLDIHEQKRERESRFRDYDGLAG